jgi:Flp pilus assembly protein TadG
MKKWFRSSVKGQIIVLFAIVLIALLGFTALAVDGSMIYSDKRAAQNAADSSAMAGGGVAAEYFENHLIRYDNFSCSDTNVINGMNQAVNYAINRAASNDYPIETNLTNENGVQVTCHVINTGPYKEQYIDITVMVTAPTTTSFAQLFYNGPIESTGKAVVRVHPRTNLGFGYSVASMGTDCSTGGISGTGNVSIVTTDGGIFSNSCISFTGNVHVDVNDPIGNGIRYVTTYSKTGNVTVDPTPVQSPVRITPYIIPAPDCGSVPASGDINLTGNNTATINPGRYGSIKLAGNSKLTLNPGLYCISGGLSMSGNQDFTGSSVTLYFTGGGFKGTGNSDIELTAPTSDQPPAVRGLLMYAAPGNTSNFDITGNSATTFRGTIYVPDGSITAVGNSGMAAMESQLVGKKITLNGNATLGIDFAGELNYQIPATLSLQQ